MMSVMRALLLSSQNKARTSIHEQVLLSLFPCEKYRLVASHYSAEEPQKKDAFTLQIFLMVPSQEGKMKVAEEAHKVCQFEGKEAFLDYLRMYDFHPDADWSPVEL